MYLVFPSQASAVIKTATEERRRSLFKVPVFQTGLKLDATFDLSGVPAAAPQGAKLDWSQDEIVVGISGTRGALADASLTANGKTVTLVPVEIAQLPPVEGKNLAKIDLDIGAASGDRTF